MTKKSVKLSINLVPLFILVALLLGIWYFFLSDNEVFNFNRAPEVRRLNGFPAIVYSEDDLEKQRLLINDEEQLAEFLNSVDKSGYLIVREDINFDKEMLLAVSTSTEDLEGQTIKIRKLYEDNDSDTILVSVRETEPGSTCEIVENKNAAVDLVAISRTIKKIEFEKIKEIKECE